MAYQPLMPKAILIKNSNGNMKPIVESVDKGVHAFPKGIRPKMNVIARREFEIAYFNVAIHHVSHKTRINVTQKIEKLRLEHGFSCNKYFKFPS